MKSERPKPVRSSDKLREEIETQMSKLDLENIDGDADIKYYEKIREVKKVNSRYPRLANVNARSKLVNNICCEPKSELSVMGTQMFIPKTIYAPVKKVPIQILSDPFTTNKKNYYVSTGDAVEVKKQNRYASMKNGYKVSDRQ